MAQAQLLLCYDSLDAHTSSGNDSGHEADLLKRQSLRGKKKSVLNCTEIV